MNLTDDQRRAVEHRGSDLLVAASAGSGKTEVLARRCLDLLADQRRPCRVDQLLVVTFTRAAAAELRARVSGMLQTAIGQIRDPRLRDHLRQQHVLLDTADIGTIDSWCARLVREHFAAVPGGVDPAFAVLGEEQAALLRRAVLDEVFDWVSTADDQLATRARDWILRSGRPGDDTLRALVDALSRYRDRLVNPDQWLDRQRELRRQPAPALRRHAQELLAAALAEECRFQHDQLDALIRSAESEALADNLRHYRTKLADWTGRLADPGALPAVVAELKAFSFSRKPRDLPSGDVVLWEDVKSRWLDRRLKKTWNRDDVERLLEGAHLAAELLLTVLDLEARYQELLTAHKRARGVCEFGDVLRLALDLLGEPADGQRRTPTPIATALQQRYEHILVDEYQDTSPVQVEILRLVARRQRGQTNRFLVGDVKQSIYAFRDAEPRLFTKLLTEFSNPSADGQVAPLRDNFRSHRALVDGLNGLFAQLFEPAFGGTAYGAQERLRARRAEIDNPTLAAEPRIRVELILEEKGNRQADDGSEAPEGIPLERIEREGLLAAQHIRDLLDRGVKIPERRGDELRLRPLRLGDIVILLRSARHVAAQLAGVLRQAGLPCVALGRESFLDSREVQDVRNALALLVNRQQDVALAAYLRGPMVGLSAGQLLAIRRFAETGDFYAAVEACRRAGDDHELAARLDAALQQLDHWSAAARSRELPALIEQIIRETGLEHFARGLPLGEHRVAMLGALRALAAEFDGSAGGVADFVEYLDALADEDLRPTATAPVGEDVVRIMTIHAAKGLEFPVVLLLGTGAEFSRRPRRAALECDADGGIGLQFLDYPGRRKLLNAEFLLNRRAARQREREEELRLLYVAATRARELLVVIGHTSADRWEQRRCAVGPNGRPTLISRMNAASALEWLIMGMAAAELDRRTAGGPPPVAVRTHAESEVSPPAARPTEAPAAPPATPPTPKDRQWVEHARAWIEHPPDTSLAQKPAVLSVSALKQQAAWAAAEDVPRSLGPPPAMHRPAFARAAQAEDGPAVGEAYHRFLHHADLSRLATPQQVEAQLARLVDDGRLAPDEARLVNPSDLVWLARTDEGKLLAGAGASCRREVPFVYGLPLAGGTDRTVLRGIIDCLLETPEGLLIIDYKTDRLRTAAVRQARVDAYALQLQLYALAAGEIFGQRVRRAALVLLREHEVVPVEPADGGLDGLRSVLTA